ncbi:hypothetical protein ACIBG8_00030 [Nonomuraea sp. NPDC050556]|uniref:hypothetical protein n=1 Tax=Nonomuraea sp. NPDC050556 TaxID=3364369 RepID=UPI0037912049
MGKHLVAAERALGEDDPDRAHEHTKVARRFAARIGVVREAAGIVAYRAGHFSEALSDLRAARRMTGSDAYLPIMADCERGMGRPERALDLVRSPEAERLDREGRIELAIVESGARRDLGQHDAAVITLQRVPELRDTKAHPWSARLAFAYADALAEAGHEEAATDWFGRAMAFDEDGETDAAERYAELTGGVIEDLEEEYDDGDVLDSAEGELPDEDALEDDDEDYDGDEDDSDEDVDARADRRSSGDVLNDDDPADLLDDDDDLDDDDRDEDDRDEDEVEDIDDEDDRDDADEDDDQEDDEDDSDVLRDDVAEGGETASDSNDAQDDIDDEDDVLDDSDDVEIEEEEPVKPTAAVDTDADLETPAPVRGVGPAFIEPDFGDILDDADEPDTKSKPDA